MEGMMIGFERSGAWSAAIAGMALLVALACTEYRPAAEAPATNSDTDGLVDEFFEPVGIHPFPGDSDMLYHYPNDAWIRDAARDRFDQVWRGSPNWWIPDPPPEEWLELPLGWDCSDVELQCRFAAYAASSSTFCDVYCSAVAIMCEADKSWNEATTLAHSCEGTGCESTDPGPSYSPGLDLLARAARDYYLSSALLMVGLGGESAVCAQYHEDSLQGLAALGETTLAYESPAPDRYGARVAFGLERFVASTEEAVGRLLARADAESGHGLGDVGASVREWFGDDAPRTLALRLILGGGVSLFPCTVDSSRPEATRARRLLDALGGDLGPDPTSVCSLASRLGLEDGSGGCGTWEQVLDTFGVTQREFDHAIISAGEQLATTRTLRPSAFARFGPGGLPTTESGLVANSAAKTYSFWRADGASTWDYATVAGTHAWCFSALSGYSNADNISAYPSPHPLGVGPYACVPATGATDAYGRRWSPGAANLLGALRELWRDIGALSGTDLAEQYPDIGEAFSALGGGESFRVVRNDSAFRQGPDCDEVRSLTSIDFELPGFVGAAVRAGIGSSGSDVMAHWGLNDDGEWHDLEVHELALVRRDSISVLREPDPSGGVEPGTCRYRLTPDASVLSCPFLTRDYGRDPNDRYDLFGTWNEINDYAGGLNTTWAEGGTAAFPEESSVEWWQQHSRFGTHIMVLGNSVVGWYSPAQFRSAWVDLSTSASGDCTRNNHETGISFSTDGRLDLLAQRIIARHSDTCTRPLVNSLDMAHDLVPPLENEATFDAVPYESSYRTYLASAETAAEQAFGALRTAAEAERQLDRATESYLLHVEDAIEDAAGEVALLCGRQPDAGLDELVAACETPIGPISYKLFDDWYGRYTGARGSVSVEDMLDYVDWLHFGSLVAWCDAAIARTVSSSDPADVFPDLRAKLHATVAEALTEPVYQEDVESTNCPEDCAGSPNDEACIEDCFGGIVDISVPEKLKDGQLSPAERAELAGTSLTLHEQIAGQLEEIRSAYTLVGFAEAEADAALTAAQIDYEQHLSSQFFGLTEFAGYAVAAFFTYGASAAMLPSAAQQIIASESGQKSAVVRAFIGILSFKQTVEQARLNIERAKTSIRVANSELQRLAQQARNAANKADRRRRVATAESIATDPWTRSTISAASRRAARLFDHSRKLSFVAEKAVEFRYVVSLEDELDANLIGTVPTEWARDVFFDGFASDDPVVRFSRPTVDFTQNLSDFARFYSYNYPFANGADTVVLSVKDHIVGALFDCCPADVPNCENADPELYRKYRDCTDKLVSAFYVDDLGVMQQRDATIQVRQYDYDGVLLQDAFRKHCVGVTTGSTRVVGSDQQCNDPAAGLPDAYALSYYGLQFRIDLNDLKAGNKLGDLGFSTENYNYRIRQLVVNLVGSNVRDCSLVGEHASNCYASAFIPYDLRQTGIVQLRDHALREHEYRLPAGGILKGKALAAERFITTPIAQADLQLVDQYWANEFAGRPFQGEFELRLFATEAFNFAMLEDVQIVVQIDYWSPFEAVP